MRHIFTFLCLILITSALFSQHIQTIQLSQAETAIELKSVNPEEFRLKAGIKEINLEREIIEDREFSVVNIEGAIRPSNVGKASLPVFSHLIEVPQGAEIQIVINSYTIEYINLNEYGLEQIMPTQPSYSKSAEEHEMVFVIDEDYYSGNTYEQNDLVYAEIYGVMRGIRIGRIEIRPYHYNPVENTLIIYNELDFEVKFLGADLALTEEMKNKFYSEQFQGKFHGKLLNYQAPATKDAFSNYNAPIKYVIVANRVFESALQDFVEWKTMKGFNVIEAYTDVVGATNTDIKTYLQNMYNNATPEDPAPLYLLIIGDHSGSYSIPAFGSTNGNPSNHVTDLYFATFDGAADYFPDMYYGRISANSVTELENALEKIIPYEMYTIPNGDHLNKAMLIAGTDNNYARTHGDATIYYGIDKYFNTDNGYTNIYAYYYELANGPGHVMFTKNNTANASASVRSRFTEGVGFANYTAHCNYDQWGDPQVKNEHIPGFNNKDKYPFMIGNCCLSYKFNESDAFGEILLYTKDAGAVAYIGTSNNSYWNEDVYWGIGLTTLPISLANVKNHTYENTGMGVYDGVWHTHGEPYSDWYYSGSQMNFRGNTEVQASTSTRKKYYWEIYHLSGDPSLVPYNTKPNPLAMNFDNPSEGSTSLIVETEPYAYIAISREGVLLDAKWSGAGTSVTLEFEALDNTPINIVGTKQDRAPAIHIDVIPDLPYPPTADFVGVPLEITEGESVSFTCQSEYANQRFWEFGDGHTSNEINPVHVYLNDGVYTVKLTVTNSLGSNLNEKINYITVIPNTDPPIADFSAISPDICDGSVQFTDESIYADTWYWDFGDGNHSTEQHPLHIYTISGIYNISLHVTNDYGDNTHLKNDYIEIHVPDLPQTTGAVSCGGNELTLSAVSNGTLYWYDLPEEGNLIHTGTEYTDFFTVSTTFWVESEISYPITSMAARPNNTGDGGYWGNNDHQHGLIFDAYQDFTLISVKVYANAAANRTITLRDNGGNIIETRTLNIPTGESRVNLNMNVPEGTDLVLRGEGNPQLFRNNNNSTTYPLTLPGVLSITESTATAPAYNAFGNYYFFYDWEVEFNETCNSDRSPVTAEIASNPSVSLGDDLTQCGGTVVLDAGVGFAVYTWNGVEGIQTYEVSSTQTITLEVEDSNGCNATDEIEVTIYPELEIYVTTTSESVFGAEDGTATVVINGGTLPYQIQWDIGSNLEQISGLAAGEYFVTVTDFNDCNAIASGTVYEGNIHEPVALFEADITTGCDVLTVQFTDLSTNDTTSWTWDFGDGNGSNEQHPEHTYIVPGVYTVSLIVSNAGGTDEIEIIDYILVGETPQITLSMTEESEPGAEDGTATVTVTSSYSYTVLWSNMGETETISNLVAGEYCVTVINTEHSCQVSDCIEVAQGDLIPEPVALFEADVTTGCNVLTVQFTDLSTNDPISWTWDFGDGNGSNEQHPEHTYTVPGVYTVSLTVTNAGGTDVMEITDYIILGETPTFAVITTAASGQNVADGSAYVEIYGGTAPYTIIWSNNAQGYEIEGLLPGYYSVMVSDANNCLTTQAFEIIWSTYSDELSVSPVFVYPNPAKDIVIIETASQIADMLVITDILGKVIITLKPDAEKTEMDISTLSEGVYFIRVLISDTYKVEKLIVR